METSAEAVKPAALQRYEDRGGAVYLRSYPVLRETPCGVWIDVWGVPKFVNLQARKQFACVTQEEAKVSFLARKSMQIKILTAQLENVNAAVKAFKEGRLGVPLTDYVFFE